MGVLERFIVDSFSLFSVPYCVEPHVVIFILNLRQGVYSTDDESSTLDTSIIIQKQPTYS